MFGVSLVIGVPAESRYVLQDHCARLLLANIPQSFEHQLPIAIGSVSSILMSKNRKPLAGKPTRKQVDCWNFLRKVFQLMRPIFDVIPVLVRLKSMLDDSFVVGVFFAAEDMVVGHSALSKSKQWSLNASEV